MLQKLVSLKQSSRKNISVIVPAVIAWVFSALGILVLQEYGLGIFIFTPLFIGITATVVYGYQRKLPVGKYFVVTSLSLLVYSAGLILFALEGAICIIMAAPLGFLIAYTGTLIGVVIVNHYSGSPLPVLTGFCLSVPLLMSFETLKHYKQEIYAVTTSVTIHQSPEKVWDHVIAFSRIPEPEELLFKAGIAYPTDAEIKGTGKGAVRYCNFSTGCFVEPITTWQKPSLLQFSVEAMPHPLKEISPYNIKPAHLHGYFVSQKGQFRLIPLAGNKTRLEGTTWYYHKIKPAFYWKLWSTHIIHKIHMRVLQHIKQQAEE